MLISLLCISAYYINVGNIGRLSVTQAELVDRLHLLDPSTGRLLGMEKLP